MIAPNLLHAHLFASTAESGACRRASRGRQCLRRYTHTSSGGPLCLRFSGSLLSRRWPSAGLADQKNDRLHRGGRLCVSPHSRRRRGSSATARWTMALLKGLFKAAAPEGESRASKENSIFSVMKDAKEPPTGAGARAGASARPASTRPASARPASARPLQACALRLARRRRGVGAGPLPRASIGNSRAHASRLHARLVFPCAQLP